MSEFVVYGIPGSPFMRSVLVALEEKRAPYRIEALAPGATRTPDYRRLHPFGRIPAIRHGDFHLYETQAILRYIDATFPGRALQPREPHAIGRMNQVIGINDWYLFPLVARVIVFERIVGPALFGKAPDEAAIAAALPDAQLCLGELDRLLGDQIYLAGDELSLADVLLAPQVYYLGATPEGASILAGTALRRWLDRVGERPSMQATLPPEPLRKAA
jgi:glutathione S-transferase